MMPLTIAATLLILLASVVCVIEIVKIVRKREVNELRYQLDDALENSEITAQTVKDSEAKLQQYKEALKVYKERCFAMAIDTMQRQGYALAVQQQGRILSTKERRRLAYSIAEPYAIDYPCNVQNYVPQLADALAESLQEHLEMLAEEQPTVQRRQTTQGQRLTPLSTQFFDVDGSTEQTKKQSA